MRETDSDILILIGISASILLFTSVTGFCGTLLHSRSLLALYAILLWPSFISLLTIGYVTYKRDAFALDRKLNLAWSEWYSPVARLVIQESLQCCGYYSPLHQAIPTKSCYARAPLPGCKGPLLRFEHRILGTIWSTVFSLVPLHIGNIVTSLLCANHVDDVFGKRIMPRRYWLTEEDLRKVGADSTPYYDDLHDIALPVVSKYKDRHALREDREERVPLLG
jgi:hypothetical protein